MLSRLCVRIRHSQNRSNVFGTAKGTAVLHGCVTAVVTSDHAYAIPVFEMHSKAHAITMAQCYTMHAAVARWSVLVSTVRLAVWCNASVVVCGGGGVWWG